MIEATHEAERKYSEMCEQLAVNSLFWKAEGELGHYRGYCLAEADMRARQLDLRR